MESQSIRKTRRGTIIFHRSSSNTFVRYILKIFQLKPREKAALEYADSLKQKFANHPQIKRIARHRQVPKHIYHHKQQLRASREKLKRKLVSICFVFDSISLSIRSFRVLFVSGKRIAENIRNLALLLSLANGKKLSFPNNSNLLFTYVILYRIQLCVIFYPNKIDQRCIIRYTFFFHQQNLTI